MNRVVKLIYGLIHVAGMGLIFLPLLLAVFAFLFSLPMGLSWALAAACSGGMSAGFYKKIFFRREDGSVASLLLAGGFTAYYLCRVGALIYDAVFPTGLLAMVNQIAHGRYPASFVAFPEIPANYHQGYVTLAAALKAVSHFPTPTCMQLTILGGVFYFAILCAELIGHRAKPLALLLASMLVIASFPHIPDWFQTTGMLNFTEYVTWGDMFLSTSLAWGMPAFLLFFLVLQSAFPAWMRSFGGAAVLLALSLFHATLFSLGLLIFFFHILVSGHELTDKKTWRQPSLYISLIVLLITWWLPQHLPTAVLAGPDYEKVRLGLRWPNAENFRQWMDYLRLSGGVLLVGAFLLCQRETFKKYRLIATSALICFLFPVVFELRNVNIWDNFHKFSVLNQFFCLLLMALTWPRRRKVMLALLAVAIGSSSFAVIDALKYRFNTRVMLYLSQPPDEPLVAFLKSQTGDVMLFGYKHNIYSHDQLSEVANHAGSFLRTSYYDNFLLSKRWEDDFHSIENWSTNDKAFADVVGRRLKNPNTYIAVETADVTEFQAKLAAVSSGQYLKKQDFKDWVLFSY